MPLPKYNPNLSLEQAIEQFDFATSELVLNPCLETAQEAFIAVLRYTGAIRPNNEKIPYFLGERFLKDSVQCKEFMKKIPLPPHLKVHTDYWIRLIESKQEYVLEHIDKGEDF